METVLHQILVHAWWIISPSVTEYDPHKVSEIENKSTCITATSSIFGIIIFFNVSSTSIEIP